MLIVNPALSIDGYKSSHPFQYPEGTNYVNANFTPRGSRMEGIDEVVHFGTQYFIKNYLKTWETHFFQVPKEKVMKQIARRLHNYVGPMKLDHFSKLHDLGYLPIEINAVPEGTKVPLRVPMLTVNNTGDFGWVTNSIETILSNSIWQGCTSATIANRYLQLFNQYADETVGNRDHVKWQGHDFSFRGMGGLDAALLSGAGHLLSFTGTDTVPAIDFLEEYYNADCEKELVGGSVPATEHSVQSLAISEYTIGYNYVEEEYDELAKEWIPIKLYKTNPEVEKDCLLPTMDAD